MNAALWSVCEAVLTANATFLTALTFIIVDPDINKNVFLG